MKISRNKVANAIALILMFAIAISLIALPTANAQAQPKKTFAYIGASPNPVGVGQEVLLHVGITLPLQVTEAGWEGLTVTVTRPDGTTETLGPFRTDATGGTGTVYVPSVVGNYTLQTHFPEQENPVTLQRGDLYIPAGTPMLASDSEKLVLVVQEQPLPDYPGVPLPTEYWTRPIDDQAREWYTIAGNWLTPSGSWQTQPDIMFAPYNEGPETAHILWTTPLTSGGLVGGTFDSKDISQVGYETGDAYEGKWLGSIIMAGKLYYEKYATADPYKEIACVDLHTGEELWSRALLNNLTLTRGQLMFWDTYDNQGVYDYLWATGNAGTRSLLGLNATAGTIWCAFDPFNGDYVYTLYGIPSGTFGYGPKGEMLIYTVNLANGWMTLWNSTNIPALYASTVYPSMGWGQWRPMGKTVNATGTTVVTPTTPFGLNGYMWNKTIPKGLPGNIGAIFLQDRVVGGRLTTTEVNVWGLNLKPGQEGQLLFNNTWNAPAYWVACDVGGFSGGGFGGGGFYGGWAGWSSEDKVAVAYVKETRELYAFSLDNGKYLWGPTEPENYLNVYCHNTAIAYGKLFSTGVSGIVYAYDITTGALLWTYKAIDPYNEILWTNNWWSRINFVTDGKIYLAHEEHSGNQPLPRGGPYYCLNATTGEEIWRVDGLFRQTEWGGRSIIGDSIIATMNTYDQRVYAIGKGPSATTVTAPDIGVPIGKSVLVRGTVTDVSPGTKDSALIMRFPNGVPAVADENMSDWMLYVYKQFPRPADAVGVEVVLSVVDPNNNIYEVGRTTSDASGLFHCAFTPEVPGEYTVIATFEGSGAYYGSFAETAINVEEAPAATPAPTPTPASVADIYFVPAVSGIIIAIAIVGVLLALLLLRKR